jgi:hypothetical protein
MALSRTNLGSWASGGFHGTGSFTTGSFTPPADSIIVAAVHAVRNGSSAAFRSNLTISGGSLTWSGEIVGAEHGDWKGAVQYRSAEVGGSPASMSITIDCGAIDVYEYIVEAFAWTGYDTGDPTGATASGGSDSATGALSISLSATAASDSEVIASCWAQDEPVGNITPSGSYTEIYDVAGDEDGNVRLQSQGASGAQTTASWASVPGQFGRSAIALEIKAASGGGTQTITAAHYSDADTTPAATVSPGAVTLQAAHLADSDAFGAATLSPGAVTIAAAAFADADGFYAATVAPGAVTIAAALHTDADAFPAATLTPGAVTITAAHHADADAFFSAVVSVGGFVIAAAHFADADAFHAATLAPGAVTITAAAFADPDSFPSATIAVEGAGAAPGGGGGFVYTPGDGRRPFDDWPGLRRFDDDAPPKRRRKRRKRRKPPARAAERPTPAPFHPPAPAALVAAMAPEVRAALGFGERAPDDPRGIYLLDPALLRLRPALAAQLRAALPDGHDFEAARQAALEDDEAAAAVLLLAA